MPKFAVNVAAEDTVMLCVAAPPSDQLVKLYCVPEGGFWPTDASTVCEPGDNWTVHGVMHAVASICNDRPEGTLWNVIEHVPDPPATPREISRVLRPGGLVVMGTPNVDALDARLFGRYWALWEAPRHLNWVVVAVGHVPEHWEQYLVGPAA